MVLLRILLFFVRIAFGLILIYYLAKLLVSWLFSGKPHQKVEAETMKKDEDFYRYLTNQEIEDADFEEVDTKEDEEE